MNTWIRQYELSTIIPWEIRLEDPKWKLNWEKSEIQEIVTELLSLKEWTRINVISTIPAIIITDWKNTLTHSNDPEAPWILTLSIWNETISLSSKDIILLMNEIWKNTKSIVN
jgi:hypothetical protein